MRIFKLVPADPDDLVWRFWEPEPVIVRAESETEARHLAEWVTVKTFRLETGVPIPINPWSAHQKITESPIPLLSLIEDMIATNEFSVDGPAAVLRHGEQF